MVNVPAAVGTPHNGYSITTTRPTGFEVTSATLAT